MAMGDTQISPHLQKVWEAADRLWTGKVWSSQDIEGPIRSEWVTSEPAHITEIEQKMAKARAFISKRRGGRAVPVLEQLVDDTDRLLVSASTSPATANELLSAHLLLWIQYSRAKQRNGDQLDILMTQAAQRFSSATIGGGAWPPSVVTAFAGAVQALQRQRPATLAIAVEDPPPGGCALFVNGFPVGDRLRASVPTVPGQNYYVALHCEGRHLAARRVVPQGDVSLGLNVPLIKSLRWTISGATLVVPDGHAKPARVAAVGAALGKRLGASEVVLAGVAWVDGAQVFQFDKIRVLDGRWLCAVRLPVSASDSLGEALYALREGRPVEDSPTTFAGADGIWGTPNEYAERLAPPASYTWTWVAAGSAVAFAGGGLLLSLQAGGLQGEVDDCEQSRACGSSAKLGNLRSDRDNTALLSGAAYVTAGVLALGAGAAFLLEGSEQADILAPAPVGLVPLIGPTSIGAGFVFEME